jgi:hypothetical protein
MCEEHFWFGISDCSSQIKNKEQTSSILPSLWCYGIGHDGIDPMHNLMVKTESNKGGRFTMNNSWDNIMTWNFWQPLMPSRSNSMKDLSHEKLSNWAKLTILQDFPLIVHNNTQLDHEKSNVQEGFHFLNKWGLFLDVSDRVDPPYSRQLSHIHIRPLTCQRIDTLGFYTKKFWYNSS